jgi:putative transposase
MPDDISLQEGQIVSHGGANWRILHAEDLDRVLARRISDGRPDFLRIADLGPAIVPEGAEMPPVPRRIRTAPPDKKLSRRRPTSRKRVSKKGRSPDTLQDEFQFALKILGLPRRDRRPIVQEMARRFGYNLASAYRRIAIVRVHGRPEALAHAVRSDAGRRRLKPGVIEIVRENLKKHRYIRTPKTLPRILDLINGDCRKKDLPEISLGTLQSFDNETTFKQKLEAQGRKKRVKDVFRPKLKHLPNNDYPLAIIQVDHTPLQICLVDEVERKPIRDPYLTLVIDTYSRMVLGFFLTFDAPSTLSTGMALAHAFLPKEDYLRLQQVDGEWPCWGYPDVVIVDNAAELNGQMMHGARKMYRFTLRDRPVGAANFGGHVESAFKTFMYEFKNVPGTKFSNPVERGEYDSEGHATFTIAEFEAYFTEFLVNDYHLREHDGEGMNKSVPLEKWRQGILEGDKFPPTGLPDRPADPLAVRISLMPFEMRVIEKGTVRLNNRKYHSRQLVLVGNRVNPTRSRDQRKFEVRFDPRNLSVVWLYDEESKQYIELHSLAIDERPISLWEDRAIRKQQENRTDQFADQRYNSLHRREEMKATSAKKTKQARLDAEKARRRSKQALVQPPPPRQPPAAAPAFDATRRERMMKKVRPATMELKPKKEGRDE